MDQIKTNLYSQRIDVNSLNIHYYTGGAGEPIIVIHGGAGGGAREWIQNMSALRRNFTVYVPDLPGFGLSQSLEDFKETQQFVVFINEFANALGLSSFHLAGHSIGGSIVLRYAVQYPQRVNKLVIINGIGIGQDMPWWLNLVSSSFLCRSVGVGVAGLVKGARWILSKIRVPLRQINPLPLTAVILGASMALFRQEAAVLVPQLAALMIPTLLVWGGRDHIVPVKNAYAAAKIIPGCRVHVFQDGGHSVYRKKIHEFAGLLTEFIELPAPDNKPSNYHQ